MADKKPLILAIDDTPANLLMLGTALKQEFELQIATSGASGLMLAEQSRPDLILLDIMMPDMDGFETCRRLKANPVLQDIPVVFVSALAEIESESSGLLLGAADYITKPVNVEIARQRIRNLIEREALRNNVMTQRDLLATRVAELDRAQQVLTQTQATLAESESFKHIVLNSLTEQIVVVDRRGVIKAVNESWLRFARERRTEQGPLADAIGVGSNYLDACHKSANSDAPDAHLARKALWGIQDVLAGTLPTFSIEYPNHSQTQTRWVSLMVSSLSKGGQGGAVITHTDITAFKAHQEQLDHIAHYDALTNLPNRVLLADRLRQGMAVEQRRGKKLAVVFLDLDGFKAVNDRYGHDAGDHLLVALTARMKQSLREGDTLARIGGDEFVAVLRDLDDVKGSVPMLVRLLHAAAQPLTLDGAMLQVSASLGVASYPQAQAVEADQLIRQADQAMYQAKLAGKNRYSFFDAEQDSGIRSLHQGIERVRQGLAGAEFVLYYQPKVNMRTGVVIGAEALIRWQCPNAGLLSPAQFLPTIENHPLAVELGEWVIDAAVTQMAAWQTQGLSLPVSVNVGARQLQQGDFVRRLQEILAAHPTVEPASLEIEILETSALEDLMRVSQVIEACRELGVTFAMDDFGTGYSSLTYLRRLRVNLLKIDQSFVHDMLDDADDLAILQGVIGLAKAFQREVIAEGVETVAHGVLLLQLGCELAQGFSISRPMPARDMPAWALGWTPDTAWACNHTAAQ